MSASPYPEGFRELPLDERNAFAEKARKLDERMAERKAAREERRSRPPAPKPAPEVYEAARRLSEELAATMGIAPRRRREGAEDAPRLREEEAGRDELRVLGEPQNVLRFKATRASDLAQPAGEEWLIKGMIPSEGVATLFGASSAYKTFVSIDLSLHVSIGALWAGRKVAQGDVVYVASEAAVGCSKRIRGAIKANCGDDPPLYLIDRPVNFGTEGVNDAAELGDDIETQGIKPKLIVIDTLAASMGSGDENGSGMGLFLANCKTLSLRFKCLVLAVHHIGHGEGAGRRERGWSGVIGNCDARLLCEKPEPQRAVVEIVKNKEGEDGVNSACSSTSWNLGSTQTAIQSRRWR